MESLWKIINTKKKRPEVLLELLMQKLPILPESYFITETELENPRLFLKCLAIAYGCFWN